MLQIEGVSYRYAGYSRPALIDVSLAIAAGEIVGVVGANESGKSTLALVASGLAPATIGGRLDGLVRLDGRATTDLAPHELAVRCGVLFQNPVTQLSGTAETVWEEVAFGPRNLGLPIPEIVERVEESLAVLRIESLASRRPTRLSGGQAQLVALAGVLAMRPGLLVLDEPTSQLDPGGTRLVADALASLVSRGTAILLVEHKTDVLARVTTRIVALEQGRAALTGATPLVLEQGALPALGVEPPAPQRLARAVAAADLPRGVAQRAQASIAELASASALSL